MKAQTSAAVPDSSGVDAAAYAKLNAGQVDEAATAFQAVLAAQPKDASALAGMGQVRMLQGNYLGAVSFLEQAKQASPNDAAIGAALDGARFQFLMGEGKDAQTAKDLTDAEKRYREALGLRPDARQAVDALVNVLVLEDKLSDAQDTLSAAVAQGASASGHPPVELELELAQLDIANNQPQLAYPIFLQVLQDSPGRVDAWSGLISSLHLMGHDTDAVAQEKVISTETRAQLEATPGFQQMMTAMAAAPQSAVAGAPSYAPFVPSVAPAQPAPVAAIATTTAPVIQNPQHVITNPVHSQTPATNVSAKPGIAKAAAPAAAKVAAVAPASSSRVPGVAIQAASNHATSNAASGAQLVTQPASRPASHSEEVPDTGEQQYPQPKARPRAASSN
jgi:tetratricopeptide (TPR) repeat protein